MNFRKTAFLFFFLFPLSCSRAAPIWQMVEPGLEETQMETKPGEFNTPFRLHAFRIDPTQFRLDLVFANSYGTPSASVRDLAQKSNALLMINSSFFDENGKPLGLLVQNKTLLQPVRDTEWGLFFIEAGRPFIVHRKDFAYRPTIEMALQTGPRLITEGKIPRFKDAIPSRRSLVGITRDGKIIFAVTGVTIATTNDLARLVMRKESRGGLGLRYALNLDGGGSSQLVLFTPSLTVHYKGEVSVPVGLGVFRK
ncbi:MAG: phosphodiester glycosidase family protein [Deltaproteobacteria bacterium]|nr:phosphodiester glycosidase family protein [Deltaproteobacteria bacterium]